MRPWERNAANLEAALKFYGRAEERGGLTLITSPVAFSVFNIALLDEPVAEVEGEIERRILIAKRHFEAVHRPWSFWVCENDVPRREMRNLYETMAGEGLQAIAESPGMDVQELQDPRRPLPLLEFRRVEDEVTRADFSMLVCASFHIPPPMAVAVYARPSFWSGHLSAWIGYAGARAVTTAATAVTNGVLGVYSVATLPEYRRMGYGEVAVRHAVARTREMGAGGPVVLQSSPGAVSLYRSLGFRTRTRFFIFATRDGD